jgi:undecaprenyl diphosphate synthase
MLQSTLSHPPGIHVAVIMDGNGRWATDRARPREFGHKAGAEAVRRIVEAAPDLGVGTLTLYAFSSDNWQRPRTEVRALMALFRRYLRTELAGLVENGVRLQVVGRRDRLAPDLIQAIKAAEAATIRGQRLLLRLAVDYSSRHALLQAARALGGQEPVDAKGFAGLLGQAMHEPHPAPDVDLLVRTGGEQRLSDFLLWECAYAELLFVPRMWPDFDSRDLAAAVRDFRSRERRFGRVAVAG